GRRARHRAGFYVAAWRTPSPGPAIRPRDASLRHLALAALPPAAQPPGLPSLPVARHDTPPRPRLGPRFRLRPARALPRGHVLRELGMARRQSRRQPGARAVHDAELAVAPFAAVPGLGRGHRLPARQGPSRGGGGRHPTALPRTAHLAAAAAVGLRHAGGGAAAVLLRGGRQAARRLSRRLPGVLGTLPGRRRQLLPGRRLPGPADLEPPVVRG